ncbi:protein SCO1/2 [Polaribacter sp. Hel1_33_78]|jgi:protein SCO1/2|uniref:SCO family protein n=1 Tax=unclassified Polaribacter TaxID=196858 RepID=UPI00087B011C|nr:MULTISPECIES: SCO family protein [unclassified Polaribacter]MBT7816999.1 SCO family protein [Polaribacter sp.]MDG1402646.1 SCO family protein [Polaribacter sp.]MDG2437377.1 SCO family protein [Polaribacter sp.]SDT91558.1 protein SCO1/2 [Polaribacter sp. Hel1_33_78]
MNKKYSYIGVSFIILLFGIYVVRNIDRRLNDNDFVQDDRLNKVDKKSGSTNSLFKFNKVPDFEFTNQEGNIITNKTYEGKVFVVEFFFSTCPTICPLMNQKMLSIQDSFLGNPDFGIASISITPEIDSPKILKEFAKNKGIKHKNWHLLTGKSEEIVYALSNKGFKLYAGKGDEEHGGFEHSGLFALVDKDGYIRSRKDKFGNPIMYYRALQEQTFPDQINELKEDIKLLLNE